MKRKKRFDSKGRELFCGEYERKDGRYEYKYRTREGKEKSIYAHRLYDLRNEESKYHLKESINISKKIADLTLNDQYEIWIVGKMNVRQNTWYTYKFIYDCYIRNSLGKQLIDEITTFDIKSLYMSLYVERHISAVTLAHIQNVMYQIFRCAVERGIINNNPANDACRDFERKHSKHVSSRVGMTRLQAGALLEFVEVSEACKRWYPLMCVLSNSGLRLSELAGLRWEDIDMEKGMINVDHAIVYCGRTNDKAAFHASSPKTDAGRRIIPIGPRTIEALKLERKYQREKGITCRMTVDGYTNFVFLNKDGKVISQAPVNRALKRICFLYNSNPAMDKNGNPIMVPSLTSHVFRHTFACILCENNVNVKVIQRLMGHADIETTMNIYVSVHDCALEREYRDKFGGDLV